MDLTKNTTYHFLMMKKIMSRFRNDSVLAMWKKGKKASSHTGALCTNGRDLFSYNLRIGYRSRSGQTILGDFTSPGGDFRSMTTSCHVGKARVIADHIMHPVVFRNSEFKQDED
mgnify:FL=1